MPHRARIILPIIFLVAIAGFIAWRITAARESTISGAVNGNGVIEATEINLTSKVAGKVIMLQAREGDDVEAGALIAMLDSGELTGNVVQSAGNLQAARAAYDALVAGSRPEEIRRARAQYAATLEAQRQAELQLNLIRSGTRDEYVRQLEAVYRQAQAQLALVEAGPRREDIAQLESAAAQAEAQLALVKEGPRPEEIAQLRSALAQAQVNLAEAERELARVRQLYTQGAAASQRVDQAASRRDVARAVTDAAQQRLTQAETGARPQEIRAAEAGAEIARQRLAAARHGARPQEVQAATAAVEAARQQWEAAKHGPRPQERQQAEAQVRAARAQAAAARATLDQILAGPRREEVAAARARVDQAMGGLKTASASAAQTKIFAPSRGRVLLRNVEPGELVTPGLPIIRLANLQTVWIRVYIPETQIGRILIGQRADVITDAFPDRRFPGRVIEIAQQPEFTPKNVQTKEERVKLVYGVKIEVDNPEGILKPGMPGDAVIHTQD